MKLSKALLGAIVVGIATQATTGCNKKGSPEPKDQTSSTGTSASGKETPKQPVNCPACGLG